MDLFVIFIGIFLPVSRMNEIRDKNFFLPFSAYLIPFWLKIMPERGILIFWIFLQFFFRNFLASVKYERNSGLKFFSLFFGLSHPVLAENNAGKWYFIFLNFFAIFFGNFLPRAEYERNSGLKFFSLFFVVSQPVLAKKIVGKRFYNFSTFFNIFLGIFLLGSSMNRIRD